MNSTTRILIVEDNPHDYDLAQREIRKSLNGCEFSRVETEEAYLAALESLQPHVILSDYGLPGFDGMKALKLAQERMDLTPFIMWTGSISEQAAAECMKAGANNYILKENITRLGPAILHALEERKLLLEHRRTEDKLRRSEANYRALAENSLQGIAIFQEQRIVYANPALCMIMGYTADELLAMSEDQIFAQTHPEDQAMARERAMRRQSGETVSPSNELRIIRKNGDIRWIQTFSNSIEYDGQPAVLSTSIDITERKHAEHRFQAIYENSPVGIFQSAPQGQFISVNPALARIFGYISPEEMIDAVHDIAAQIYLQPEDRTAFVQVFEKQEAVHNFEAQNRRKDGSVIWTSTSARVVRGQDGNVLYYEGFLYDITARKEADEKLIESEKRFRALIANGMENISLLADDGTLLWEDPSTNHVLGYEHGRFVDENIFQLLHADDAERVTHLFAELVHEPGRIREAIFRLKHRDGAWRWIEAKATNMLEEPSVRAIVLNYRDVTERRLAEARINDLLSWNEKILNHTPLGILAYKLTGECIFANERSAEIVGTTVENLRAQNFHTIESWKKSGLYALVMKATTARTMVNGDVHHVSTFGKEIWMSIRCVLFKVNEDEHLLLSVSDISERKRTEEELKQKNDDLRLLNAVNNAMTRSQNLDSIMGLLSSELKHIFSAVGSTIYMLGPDKRSISMQQYSFSPEIENRIEKLIGFKIPRIEIPIKDGGHFHNTLITKQSAITSDPQKIQEWIAEFAETKFLPSVARAAVRKLIPHIYKLLNIKSTIIVPLISGEDVIGFLDVSSAGVFTANDLKRIETIAEQLTSLIQRQQANDRVRKSEEFLQGIQNSLTAHIAILDEGGTIVQINEAWREFGDQNGLQIADHGIGLSYFDVCETASGPDADVARQVATLIREVLAGTRSDATVEYPCHSPLEKRWFTLHISCLHDSEQKWVILAHENITARRLAEEEVRQSEERYRTVVENQTEFIVRWKDDGVRTFVNDAYCRYFGITAEQALNSDFMPFVHEEDRQAVQEKIARLARGTSNLETDTHRVITADGSIGWNEWTDQAIRDEKGRLIEFQSVGRDITERKRAEQELRAEQEKVQRYLDIAGVLILALDWNGTVTLINQKGCEILGYPNHEIVGKNWINTFIPESMRDEMQDVFDKLIHEDADRFQYYENPVLTRSGEQRMIAWHNTLVRDENGTVVTSLSSGEDITERKRTENELRASEERFRQLATNIRDVFWITDAQTQKEVYISPAVESVWGCSPEYLMNTPDAYINSILPEDRSMVTAAMENQRKGEKTEIEYRIRHSDGSVHWVWDRAFPIFDETGRVVRLAGIAANITQRKQSELESQRHLAELEALYENGLAVGQLLEAKEIGSQIIKTFARYLSWHHVAIRLLNPETNRLELIAFNQPDLSDEARAEIEARFNSMVSNVGQGLSGWAMQSGSSIRTGNVHTHPQYVDTHEGIMSGLYMPLRVGDRMIGCISVESDIADAFTLQDERLLATLANQAAIAFENARLYQAAQLEISERRRAQEALWQSETHYRQLADSITDILFELDQDLRYTYWNKASEMFSGIPAEDAIGRSIRDVFGDSSEQLQREETYKAVLQDRQARVFETAIFANGQKRYLEISAYPSARGVSVVAKDITERRLTDILMQKRFELMEYAAHQSLEEVMQRTIDEVSDLTESHLGFLHLVDEDQKTIRFQAWSSETLRSMDGTEKKGMHHPLDAAGVWADAVRQRQPVIHNNYESLTNKNGLPEEHVPVQREMVVPIIRNEKIAAVLGIGNKAQEYTLHDLELVQRFADYAWDVAERKQMENALADERNQLAQRVEERTADLSRANSNLARALRVKDEFLANMSHELRTPLNAILGLSESLGEQVAGPLNEKQQKYLATINESGHHLLALINDILDLAKIEAGQISLDINKVDVNGVCQASLRMVKQLAQRKNQEVNIDIEPNIGLMWADERRLKQMIVNLLSNAVKFTPESGSLGLEVRGDRDGNKISISVWDRGIGISNNDIQRLFKPFVQLDSGLAREAAGTGLGLALVSQMAKLHGGSVTVESHLGQGSRFTIMLPWEPALAGESSSRLRSTGKFRAIDPNEVRPTVLLIEDTREVVMMLVDYLEMAGFNMVTAQDGIDGLTQAKISHPDLILMDIQMPRMDGFETTKKLRSDPEFKETPIIALTALAMPNDRQRCLDVGMNEYLSKPVNLKALSKTIKSFLYESETNES